MSIFDTLNSINVGEHIEKKNGLSYLAWAWAWAEVKKKFPEAQYTIYENKDGWNYHTDGKTAWVKTGVTIDGLEHIEYLPVMDMRNRSIPVENVTSFDVNKAIQRSLTKACARHGLGLYIYAGEDLPEAEQPPVEIPNVSADTLRKEIFVIAAAKGYTEEQMTANPYKKYGNKMFADLTVDELRDLKQTLSARKDK
jgi:hypothetical protein